MTTIPERLFGPAQPSTGEIKGVKTYTFQNKAWIALVEIFGGIFGIERSKALSEASGQAVFINRRSLNRFLTENRAQTLQDSMQRDTFVNKVIGRLSPPVQFSVSISSALIRECASQAVSTLSSSASPLVLVPHGTGPSPALPSTPGGIPVSRPVASPHAPAVIPSVGISPERAQLDARKQQIRTWATRDGVVAFYKGGPTSFLGNFSLCPRGITLTFQGQMYGFRCAEAAFQWKKFVLAAQHNGRPDLLNDPRLGQFYSCDGECAFQLRTALDSSYPGVYAPNWLTGERDKVMWEILQAKFQQNPEMRELLDATRPALLLEHNERPGRDPYWSDNHDGRGENMLGRMLMTLRDGSSTLVPARHQEVVRSDLLIRVEGGIFSHIQPRDNVPLVRELSAVGSAPPLHLPSTPHRIPGSIPAPGPSLDLPTHVAQNLACQSAYRRNSVSTASESVFDRAAPGGMSQLRFLYGDIAAQHIPAGRHAAVVNAANASVTHGLDGTNAALSRITNPSKWGAAVTGGRSLEVGDCLAVSGPDLFKTDVGAQHLFHSLGRNYSRMDPPPTLEELRQDLQTVYRTIFQEARRLGLDTIECPMISGDLFRPANISLGDWAALNSSFFVAEADKWLQEASGRVALLIDNKFIPQGAFQGATAAIGPGSAAPLPPPLHAGGPAVHRAGLTPAPLPPPLHVLPPVGGPPRPGRSETRAHSALPLPVDVPTARTHMGVAREGSSTPREGASVPPPSMAADLHPAGAPDLRPPPTDFRSAFPTGKLREMPAEAVCPEFTPLTEVELQGFLLKEEFRDLMELPALHGLTVRQIIFGAHSNGLEGRIPDSSVCQLFARQMQYVMYAISHAKPDDQKKLLRELTNGMQDCAPVAQRTVDALYQRLIGAGGFEASFTAFIKAEKEKAVDRVIERMYPRFTDPTYDPSSDRPWNQQPHLKNGFIRHCGGAIGLKIGGSDTDPHANRNDPLSRREEFLRLFQEEFSVETLAKDFVRQVNGPSEGALRREINNETFFKWCGECGLGPEVLYDEEHPEKYPSYTHPEDAHTGGTAAYITEQTALSVFAKLGYISSDPTIAASAVAERAATDIPRELPTMPLHRADLSATAVGVSPATTMVIGDFQRHIQSFTSWIRGNIHFNPNQQFQLNALINTHLMPLLSSPTPIPYSAINKAKAAFLQAYIDIQKRDFPDSTPGLLFGVLNSHVNIPLGRPTTPSEFRDWIILEPSFTGPSKAQLLKYFDRIFAGVESRSKTVEQAKTEFLALFRGSEIASMMRDSLASVQEPSS